MKADAGLLHFSGHRYTLYFHQIRNCFGKDGKDFAYAALARGLTATTGTASFRCRGIGAASFRSGNVCAAVGSAATLSRRGIATAGTFLLRLTLTATTTGSFCLTALDAQHIAGQIQPTCKLGVSGVASSNNNDVLHCHNRQLLRAKLLQILGHGFALDELGGGTGQVVSLNLHSVLLQRVQHSGNTE